MDMSMRRLKKQREERLARRTVAAEWMEILKAGERSDRVAFDEWLRESRLNIECYLELEALDQQVQALQASDRPDIEAIAAQARSGTVALGEFRPYEAAKPASPSRASWNWMGLAASVAVAALAVTLYRGNDPASDGGSEQTARGEQRALTLADGSVIRMNAETKLKIDYGLERRHIQLIAGEAIFTVAKDVARPFIVSTPTASIRALGTQFNVFQRESTVVSVLEGQVQLTSLQQTSAQGQRLIAGEEAQVSQGRIQKRANPDVAQTVAWRQRGQLYFSNAALEDIVREFNQQGGGLKIQMEGIEPGMYRFGGTFNVEDPMSLADILEQQNDLVVERRAGSIVIRAR